MPSRRIDSIHRRVLAAGAATVTAAGLARTTAAQTAASAAPPTLPAYVAWKKPEHMIVHTATTIETKRTAFGTSVITPADRLYIRNNLPPTDASIVANREAWVLNVEGVRQPR